MKTESLDRVSGLDRLATSDEIRAAVELYSGCGEDEFVDTALLIPHESGGYVRIPFDNSEYSELLTELTRWLK